jgi:L,D-transpeptidase ErfK/SrfK
VPTPVVGTARTVTTGEGDDLIRLARAMGVGYEALARANPGVDPWLPGADRQLLLPFSGIFPGPLYTGITVNLAELRLYYLWREGSRLRARIYPVGAGIEGWETPEEVFTIRGKIEKPTWTVPPSIRKERPELPRSVPPGPDNPLGEYWLGLSRGGYGIHGTNEPFGVGRRVSHGCLRLYPEDIRDLFARVEIGTPVRIIFRPVKVGVGNDALFVEIHPDARGVIPDPAQEIRRQAAELGWRHEIDWAAVEREVEAARGVPTLVSRR